MLLELHLVQPSLLEAQQPTTKTDMGYDNIKIYLKYILFT